QRNNKPIPAKLFANIVSATGGDSHSLALDDQGVIWSWGENYYGQLGDGTTNTRTLPKPLSVFNDHKIVAIAGADDYSIALDEDGSVWSWGYNYYGQLGRIT